MQPIKIMLSLSLRTAGKDDNNYYKKSTISSITWASVENNLCGAIGGAPTFLIHELYQSERTHTLQLTSVQHGGVRWTDTFDNNTGLSNGFHSVTLGDFNPLVLRISSSFCHHNTWYGLHESQLLSFPTVSLLRHIDHLKHTLCIRIHVLRKVEVFCEIR